MTIAQTIVAGVSSSVKTAQTAERTKEKDIIISINEVRHHLQMYERGIQGARMRQLPSTSDLKELIKALHDVGLGKLKTIEIELK